ncbi:hypothetical protein [Plantactinospora sp. WMMB782]|uniref:hypothetical protein n=1 Tax=Plantactinospora sp. WMMB782 TaxID=3404121 RepID=UPI003B94FF9B
MYGVDELRAALPGTWRVLATTFPMWLSGRRLAPTFDYTLLPGDPLVLRDEVRYRTRSGKFRSIVGTDRFDPASGGFVWRGRHLLAALTSRWRVARLSDDGGVATLTFGRSMLTPAGVDIIGRGVGDRPELRASATAESLGLDPAGFAALCWLPPVDALKPDERSGHRDRPQ